MRGVSAGLTWLALAERRRGRAAQAAALLAEALPLVERVGDRPVAAPLLDVLAGLLLDGDQPEAAARMLGAAHALRAAMGAPLRPCDRPWREAIASGAPRRARARAVRPGRGGRRRAGADRGPGRSPRAARGAIVHRRAAAGRERRRSTRSFARRSTRSRRASWTSSTSWSRG